MLEGFRIPLVKVGKAAGVFLGASQGMSAHSLGGLAGISTLTARRLIKKFHEAMELRPDERLDGYVQIGKFTLTLHPAKVEENVPVTIAAAIERNPNHLANRVALGILDPSNVCPWRVYMDMVREQAVVEMRPILNIREALQFYGYQVRQADCDCADIQRLVEDILGRTYRYAIDRNHLPGYLNEVAYRWNTQHHPQKAVECLMHRLTTPPYLKKPPHKRDEYTDYLMAMP
jgi:hypothetical protein